MNENTLFTHYFYKLWVKIKIIFSKNNDQDCVQVNAEMVLRSDSSPTALVRALGMWTGFSILFNVFLVLVDLLHLSYFFFFNNTMQIWFLWHKDKQSNHILKEYSSVFIYYTESVTYMIYTNRNFNNFVLLKELISCLPKTHLK